MLIISIYWPLLYAACIFITFECCCFACCSLLHVAHFCMLLTFLLTFNVAVLHVAHFVAHFACCLLLHVAHFCMFITSAHWPLLYVYHFCTLTTFVCLSLLHTDHFCMLLTYADHFRMLLAYVCWSVLHVIQFSIMMTLFFGNVDYLLRNFNHPSPIMRNWCWSYFRYIIIVLFSVWSLYRLVTSLR